MDEFSQAWREGFSTALSSFLGSATFGDYVFFLRIGDDVFFLGIDDDSLVETPRELQIVRHVCSVKKSEKIGQFLLKNVRDLFLFPWF